MPSPMSTTVNILDNGMYELQDRSRSLCKFMHEGILTQHLANYCYVVKYSRTHSNCQLQNFQTRRGQESVSNRFDHSK